MFRPHETQLTQRKEDKTGRFLQLQETLFFSFSRVAFGLPYCWLSYFTLVCLWYGGTVGRAYGHVITKISWMGRLPNFLNHGAPLRARGAPLQVQLLLKNL